MKQNKTKKRAFSLIELSVVLVIIAIITGGVLSSSTVALNNAKTKITKERINAVYKALGSYMLKNYRLPCPAPLNVGKGSTGYGNGATSDHGIFCNAGGVYRNNISNDVFYGAVPVNDLGLSQDLAEDGFGNKLVYVVNQNFTIADYPNTPQLGFSSYQEGLSAIKILQVDSGNIIDNNAFAIISLGANKYGAFNANSSSQNSATSVDSYEAMNYLTSIDATNTPPFADYGVSRTITGVVFSLANSSSDIFDDIVFAKSRSQMVLDFNAMFLIPCSVISGYNWAYYGQTVYRSTNCNTPNSVKPSKRCEAFGTWIDNQTCFN